MTLKPEEQRIGDMGDTNFKWGFGGAIEAGFSYDDWRIGLEAAYLRTKVKSIEGHPLADGVSVKFYNLSGMVNVYHDFAINDMFDIYAGVGAGLSRTKAEMRTPLVYASDHDTHFTWQVMGGITYHMNENWGIKAGYRFFKVQARDFPDVHCLELGLRYSF